MVTKEVGSPKGQKRGVESIDIKGARVHNLKNVDVSIPKNKLVVITGVSGSGKSSLTIDTLYAEGQRRYVESLSSYARQFLMRMNKPDVDMIDGIVPAIAIEQRVASKNTRSTVGTTTEVYDYLRLLFARIGRTYSPKSGKEVTKTEVSDVVDHLLKLEKGTRVHLLAPVRNGNGRSMAEELNVLLQKGFSRIWLNNEAVNIEDYLAGGDIEKAKYEILIDRFAIDADDEDNVNRIADSVQTAFFEGDGECVVLQEGGKPVSFTNRFELDGILFHEPNPHFFSFNSPYGACKACEGFGSIIGIDEDLVVPDKRKSVYEGAIACWRGEKMGRWKNKLVAAAEKFDFPIHRPYGELTKDQRRVIWTGNEHFKGIESFFEKLEAKSYKIQNRVMLSRYRGKTTCSVCEGSRLREETSYVKINDRSMSDLLMIPIIELVEFFDGMKLKKHEKEISDRIFIDIKSRLEYMLDVGLGYLTLNRVSGTLSGGEAQRINLTRALGSNLVNSLYILDEPSIGLHPRDTNRLIKVIHNLRNLGNTVVVVEHDEDFMKSADHIVDMGPLAGSLGGEVVFDGSYKQIMNGADSLTAKYLKEEEMIPLPARRRKSKQFVKVSGARQHNLQNISASFPLNAMSVVTGVSGSGKTTLIKHILYPALRKHFDEPGDKPGEFDGLSGNLSAITQVELVDQNPLGRSSRSNPVTYIKAYDAIRDLFSKQQLSKMRGYTAKYFSFNVDGGRCDTCKGDGEQVVEMQFLADIHLECEACGGKRFNADVLEVKFKEKDISDVLQMTVDEAMEFFSGDKEVIARIKPLADVGLGYVRLGQSSSTLSGGEAQRVKLASFLTKGAAKNPVLFIFDEPSTGLHFHDIKKLMEAFDALIEKGHSVIVIEHNLDIIKCADWVVDLGPEGGDGGGQLVYEGAPEGLSDVKESVTATYLAEKLPQ
jgi:excinuclease ABC subunit A